MLVHAVGATWSFLRLRAKMILRRFVLRDSFCKDCGIDLQDFQAPDDIWKQVAPQPDDVFCYQCFVERCYRAGLPGMYRLVPLDTEEVPCP